MKPQICFPPVSFAALDNFTSSKHERAAVLSPPEQEEGQIPPQITLPPQQTHKSQSVDDSRSRCDADNTGTCFVPIDQTVFSDGLPSVVGANVSFPTMCMRHDIEKMF